MKFTYFNARGLGETVRYLFELAETRYEDDRIEFTFATPGDFSTISRPAFDELKQCGALVASMNKLPMLTVEGVSIGQSKAIERYVAKRFGFMGSTDLEGAQIDAICEHIRDMKDGYKKAKAAATLDEWWPQFADASRLLDGGIPISLSNASHPTLAHVTVYNFYYWFFDAKEKALSSLQGCESLTNMCDLVRLHPRIIHWEETRPETPF